MTTHSLNACIVFCLTQHPCDLHGRDAVGGDRPLRQHDLGQQGQVRRQRGHGLLRPQPGGQVGPGQARRLQRPLEVQPDRLRRAGRGAA